MGRKPPVRRKRGKARAQSHVSVTDKDKEVVMQEQEDEILYTHIPAGPAGVGVTHGAKWWGSTRENGMTVESTCFVSMPCQGDTESLEKANDKASELAYRFAFKNGEKMYRQLEKEFSEEGKR